MKERFRSALLGTALGDAWGYPYQMPPQQESTPLPDQLVISDDTQMTLALSAAMQKIDESSLDRRAGMETIGEQFIAYHRDQDYNRFPGQSTDESLQRLEEYGASGWEDVASHSGGSGAVMRVSASALLAPDHEGVGWSVLQATVTHNSGVARAAAAVAASLFLAKRGSNLIAVADGLKGDPHFDGDTLLSTHEKDSLIEDINSALIRDLTGPDVPLQELISRTVELHKHLSPRLAKDDFESLYQMSRKIVQIIGKGWDAGSCVCSALLLTQLYLDHKDLYSPHDFLHVAVNWPGNRNTRGSLTGALIGAHLANGVDDWEETREYHFETRYDKAIHCGMWRGFTKAAKIDREAGHARLG